MKVSLITTVKNEARHADSLISAILAQTRQPDEWVVVDGGSIDDTAAKFKAIPLCTVLEYSCNRARGRNLAIMQAGGEVIAVTDAGCLPSPTWLEHLISRVRKKERRIAAGQTICRVRSPFDATQHALMDQFVTDRIRIRQPTASCRSLAFHREAWEECPFPEWLDTGEDSWLLIRWRDNGWTMDFVREGATEWIPQQSFGGFVRQYFRYIRGEGQAGIHSGRHLLRIVFYLGLVLLPLAAGLHASALLVSCAIWLTYFLVTTLRLSGVVRGRPPSFAIRALCWMLPALPAMDAAKTAGFIVGSLERLLAPKYRRNG
jgi:glycosyltransferase involved in cell wall biosynthesis